MEIRHSREQKIEILELVGRLDNASTPALELEIDKLRESAEEKLLVDLRKLVFVSSTGLAALLKLAKQMQTGQRELVLCELGDAVKQVFDVTGITSLFSITGSKDEAVRRLSS